MGRVASFVRVAAIVVGALCTIVVVYYVVYVFAMPECVSYGRGRQVLHQGAMIATLVLAGVVWAVLVPRRRLTWLLPPTLIAVLVASLAAADALGDHYGFETNAAACM